MFNSFFPLRDTRSKNQKCLKWQKQTTKWFPPSVSSCCRTCRQTSRASRNWRFLTSEKAAWSSTARWSSPNQCRTTSPRPSTVSWRSSAPLPPRTCTSRSTPVLWMLNQVQFWFGGQQKGTTSICMYVWQCVSKTKDFHRDNPELMTIGVGWNVDQLVNWKLCSPAQLPVNHTYPV